MKKLKAWAVKNANAPLPAWQLTFLKPKGAHFTCVRLTEEDPLAAAELRELRRVARAAVKFSHKYSQTDLPDVWREVEKLRKAVERFGKFEKRKGRKGK